MNGEEVELHKLTYKWAPFTSKAYPIEWKRLVNHEVTYRHIRCHQLKKEDDLPFRMASMDSAPCTEALLLINTENDYDVNPHIQEKPIFPVLVVTAESGQLLMEALDKSEIEVMVELSKPVDLTRQSSELMSPGWFGRT